MPLQIIAPPPCPPDRVVIQVGDIKLTAGQLDQILEAYPDNQRVFANGPGRNQFIDQVVRVLLLSEEGRRRKLTETEVYQESAHVLRRRHPRQLIPTRTSGTKAQGDEALLKAYYEAHKGEYEQVRARHILIRMQGSPLAVTAGQKDLTEAEALAKAQEIRQKIVDGADFAALARAESNDTGSNVKGGDLGFLKRGQIVPSFEEAAFALPVGEISQPVKTYLRLSHHQGGREEAHQNL